MEARKALATVRKAVRTRDKSVIALAKQTHRTFFRQGYVYDNAHGLRRPLLPDGSGRTDCTHFASWVLWQYLRQAGLEGLLPRLQLKSWDFANMCGRLKRGPWLPLGRPTNRLSDAELAALSACFKLVYVRDARRGGKSKVGSIRKGDLLVYLKTGSYGRGHVEFFVSQGNRTLKVISCGRESNDVYTADVLTLTHRSLADVDFALRVRSVRALRRLRMDPKFRELMRAAEGNRADMAEVREDAP
ncbi:MAG: hypothetical protein Q4D06_08690 [Coriobacteriia bacterium]|nr:hypothetical protein [Coriobacteriia bacterium]